MNERFKELLVQSINEIGPDDNDKGAKEKTLEKFAELIVKEVLKESQQVWYELNDLPTPAGESPRDIGIRIGKKAGVLKVTQRLMKHFGVKE